MSDNINMIVSFLRNIYESFKNMFKCCCPTKLICMSTCCDAELQINNDTNNENKKVDKKIHFGNFDYSYHKNTNNH